MNNEAIIIPLTHILKLKEQRLPRSKQRYNDNELTLTGVIDTRTIVMGDLEV